MKMMYRLLILPAALLLTACPHDRGSRSEIAADEPVSSEEKLMPSRAERFSIKKIGNLKLITVINPWQKAEGVTFRYLLGDAENIVPDSLADVPFFSPPLDRVVILSTTHVAYLDALDKTEAITGMSGTAYLYNPELVGAVKSGEVREIGADRNLNYELIIGMDPDAVFLYGVDAGISRVIRRLESSGIPVIVCADYLESHPLGRAEWIRFFAAFFDEAGKAGRFFSDVECRYDSIAQMASAVGSRPTAFLGLPWKNTWFIAGGNSFAARFLEDAGAAYVWSDLDTREARPVNLEAVYARVAGADYWINPGSARSLADIITSDSRFGEIAPVKYNRVFNNNSRLGPGGGNDYWESGVVQPHLVLQDLYRIFHGTPEERTKLTFYRQLQ